MAAGHLICSLRLFVLFFLICKVRCSTGTRNCNITATCWMRESFFSRVIYYGPNRDASYNPCEIPIATVFIRTQDLWRTHVYSAKEQLQETLSLFAVEIVDSNFTLNVLELQSRNICSWFLATKVGSVNHVIWNLCRNFHFTPHYRTLRRQKI